MIGWSAASTPFCNQLDENNHNDAEQLGGREQQVSFHLLWLKTNKIFKTQECNRDGGRTSVVG